MLYGRIQATDFLQLQQASAMAISRHVVVV